MVARYPDEHERYNATHYPGTRQLCSECGAETDRCEEDAMYVEGLGGADDIGPLCEACYGEIRARDGVRDEQVGPWY